MAITLAQAVVGNGAGTTTTTTVTLGSTATAGNLLVAVCGFRADHTCATPTGFTLAKAQTATSDTTHQATSIFYKVAVGSETSVVFTIAAGNGNLQALVLEYAPGAGQAWTAPLDQVAGHDNGNGTSADVITAVTTTHANEVVVTGLGFNATGSGTPTSRNYTGTFTEQGFQIGVSGASGTSVAVSHRIVTSTLTTASTASWTNTQNNSSATASFFITAAGSAPANTVAPVASGTPTVGSTVSVTTGTWTDDGSPTFTYQWQRDLLGNASYSNIAAATSNTYVLTLLDDSCNVRCVVTDTDSNGATAANSNSILDLTDIIVPAFNAAQHGRAVHRSTVR